MTAKSGIVGMRYVAGSAAHPSLFRGFARYPARKSWS
jgi:hypothetical protein